MGQCNSPVASDIVGYTQINNFLNPLSRLRKRGLTSVAPSGGVTAALQ